ncbi:MAG TPA: hypothetical protein GX505_01235 [Clostridiales bacterium]|nr:hypothetical protein [Clostridiales bacterium]
MNKDVYISGMNKLKASKSFHARLEKSLTQPYKQKMNYRKTCFIPAFFVMCLLLFLCINQITTLLNNRADSNWITNEPQASDKHASNNGKDKSQDEFRIIGKSDAEASYIAVVYIDGFAYEPSEWLKYSLNLSDDTDYNALKGKKLGEVTLDLKGKKYKGTPPDFSSTYDIGTEIYEIKNVDPTCAVLVNLHGNYEIFYRERKYVSSIYEPIGLSMSEVFNMLSDHPEIISVELRSGENGSWMATSEDENLLALANKELPQRTILNYGEIDKNPYDYSYRIPLNLIFADGRALNIQVYPAVRLAYAFGGYIPVSEELCDAFKALYKQGSPYPLISDLIPYNEEQISYLYLKNHTNGDEVICENPQWSAAGLYAILSYYRVEETAAGDSRLVMTAILGKSETDNITVNFYETAEKRIITEIQGIFYKPVRGQLMFKSLDSYLYNNTDL